MRNRKLTPHERAEKKRRKREFMTIFVNGKQKRVRRPVTIDGMDVDEFIRRNADPIWLHQNEMWELMEEPDSAQQIDPPDQEALRFAVEAAYADSIFRSGLGDQEGAIDALERSLEFDPSYAPAILSMGSVEYQRGRSAEGRQLFQSLFSLADDTPDLCKIIDEAGDFLIQLGAYEDGHSLYRAAVLRFPESATLHQGLGCCAGHQNLHDEAVKASERALELEPNNQALVNDLGWSLLQAGRLWEAEKMLARAVAMDASYELARENLRVCHEKISNVTRKPAIED